MSKRVFRYHFDFLDGQEKWLNSMAAQGWRLSECHIMSYEFEPCEPGAYQYAVEFVGTQRASQVDSYRHLLKEMGCKTWSKNLNANYSIGHVRWRPWAGAGSASISTSSGIGDTGRWNQELLIVERPASEEPFQLHTGVEDRLTALRTVRRSYAWGVGMLLALLMVVAVQTLRGACAPVLGWIWGVVCIVFILLFGIPALKLSKRVKELEKEHRIWE